MWRIQCGPGTLPSRALRFPALLLCGLLAACAAAQEDPAQIGLVEGFAGLVAADDPRATVVGRDVLGNGGNAADAAVAMYFTLAVTLPSRASLGGGGVCVMFDRGTKSGEVIEFLPQPSGAGLVPLGVRAMAALHARQGLQRWEELVAPAESLARFGHGVSRAFARDLAEAGALLGGSDLAETFRAPGGGLAAEGDRIVQGPLASLLGGIRAQGAAYVHGGPFARRLVEATRAAGLPIEAADLRDGVPRLYQPGGIKLGHDVAYFSAPPAGGILAAQLWRALGEEADYAAGAGADRAHLFAEVAMRAFAGRSAWLGTVAADGVAADALAALADEAQGERLLASYDAQRHLPASSLSPAPRAVVEGGGGTGFVAADRFGNAVACSLTMNGLFGSGRMAPGTGILLAAPPAPGYNGLLSPSAVVVANTVNGDIRFAAAASGGAAAATSLAQVMLGVFEEERPLSEAVGAPRLHHGGAPDELFYEDGLPPEVRAELLARGHAVQEATALGLVEALHCPAGILDGSASCAVASDPRGHGLAAVVQ